MKIEGVGVLTEDPLCCICGHAAKTIDHMLRRFPNARKKCVVMLGCQRYKTNLFSGSCQWVDWKQCEWGPCMMTQFGLQNFSLHSGIFRNGGMLIDLDGIPRMNGNGHRKEELIRWHGRRGQKFGSCWIPMGRLKGTQVWPQVGEFSWVTGGSGYEILGNVWLGGKRFS